MRHFGVCMAGRAVLGMSCVGYVDRAAFAGAAAVAAAASGSAALLICRHWLLPPGLRSSSYRCHRSHNILLLLLLWPKDL